VEFTFICPVQPDGICAVQYAEVHTLAFIVLPFTKTYIDNMATTCDIGAGVEAKPRSQLKTLYR
jgi:hypothetical protein